MSQFVCAIDQGTSSTRCIVFSSDSSIVGVCQKEHTQFFPQVGWVEHDPDEIWERTIECVNGALANGALEVSQIAAVGITNQRETTVVWNRHTGAPYYKAIVWNDTRTKSICDQLSATEGTDRFRQKTGLPLNPYFSGTKLMWLLDTVPGLRADAERGDALFGTIDTWLVWKLTCGKLHITDCTNASRTLLMNIKTCEWDDELLGTFNIPKKMLPAIRSSSEHYGLASVVLPGIPIAGILGDQQAALFGQCCTHQGEAKVTYGTGAFLLVNTGPNLVPSTHGLLTTVAYRMQGQNAVYALEGSVAYAGSLIQWLRDNLCLISSARESETAANQVQDSEGLYFVPAFAGLMAPYWRTDARGVVVGLTAYHTKYHVVRAALEACAFQVKEVLDAVCVDSKLSLQVLKVDGGMTANDTLMQIQADLLDVDVVRPRVSETTSLGAAFAAGLAVGVWANVEQLRNLWAERSRWKTKAPQEIREARMRQWRKAVQRTLNWVGDDDPKNTRAPPSHMQSNDYTTPLVGLVCFLVGVSTHMLISRLQR